MKRFLCVALALVMLLGVFSVATPVGAATSDDAVPAGFGRTDATEDAVMPLVGSVAAEATMEIQATSDSSDEKVMWMRDLEDGESYTKMSTSQMMIDIIKDFEGFSATAYADNTQWTIGYGSYAGDIDDPKPSTRLTESEAEKLLIEQLDTYETVVNNYCKKIGKQPTQNQFDALLDLTYNLGGSWTTGKAVPNVLTNAVTELELVRGFGQFSRSGGSVSYIHCNRRIREALIFLYGEYYRAYGDQNCKTDVKVVSNDDLPHFKVVIFQSGKGKLSNGKTDYAYYYAEGEYYMEFPTATRSGYTLMGWKITKISNVSVSDQEKISIYDKAEYNLQLTAIWQQGNVEVEPDPIPDDLVGEEEEEDDDTKVESVPGVSYVNETPFADINTNQWFYESVEYVYTNGLMNGTTATSFDPDGIMTRGMLVTVLYRMAGSPEVSDEQRGCFSDIDGMYFEDAVAWAYANGIVNGKGANTFAPMENVTRQDAVTIFYRYYVNYLGNASSSGGDLSSFADAGQVAAYAMDAMSWAVDCGVITGSSENGGLYLCPGNNLTRAQGAALLTRLDRMN